MIPEHTTEKGIEVQARDPQTGTVQDEQALDNSRLKRPRILLFADWFLPGYKAGGPIRSCANLIAQLHDSYEFLVVTRDTDYCETTPYPEVTSNAWNESDHGARVYYFSADRLNTANLKRICREAAADIIYINGVYSFYFSIWPLFHFRNDKRLKVVAPRGMLAASAISVKKGKKQWYLRLLRKLGWHRGYRYHATKQEEVADIQRELGENVEVLMVENLPRKAADAAPAVIGKQPGELRLVHVARISPEKNLDYALKVLGKLSGNVRFDVYGPIYNAEYWEQCQEIIAGLPPNIEVVHHGSVNSGAVMEVVSAAHAMLMPTRGENYGHIIIESLLAGRPVVISDQTPWRQLAEQHIGWDLSLNDPDAFVRVLQELVDMPAESFGAYAAAAHAFARKEVARPGLVAGYHHLFERPPQ